MSELSRSIDRTVDNVPYIFQLTAHETVLSVYTPDDSFVMYISRADEHLGKNPQITDVVFLPKKPFTDYDAVMGTIIHTPADSVLNLKVSKAGNTDKKGILRIMAANMGEKGKVFMDFTPVEVTMDEWQTMPASELIGKYKDKDQTLRPSIIETYDEPGKAAYFTEVAAVRRNVITAALLTSKSDNYQFWVTQNKPSAILELRRLSLPATT